MKTKFKNVRFGLLAVLLVCFSASCDKDNLDTLGQEDALEAVKASSTKFSKKPVTAVYVEVNSNNIRNVGAYTFNKKGKGFKKGDPFFDIAIIFAANINYNQGKKQPFLFLNDNVKDVLRKRAKSIKPLQRKGVKVLLSILGNRQGAGISNFQSRSKAKIFAKQVANVVKKNGLDGVDLDDEFADYGINGTGQPNASSFIILLEELRKAMPKNKLITFFNFGTAARFTSFNGKKAGKILDYSWQGSYGIYSTSPPVGVSKSRYSPSANWINDSALSRGSTSKSRAVDNAQRTKREGYGAYFMYDLTNANNTDYINSVSKALYGSSGEIKRTDKLRNKGQY